MSQVAQGYDACRGETSLTRIETMTKLEREEAQIPVAGRGTLVDRS